VRTQSAELPSGTVALVVPISLSSGSRLTVMKKKSGQLTHNLDLNLELEEDSSDSLSH
jgi:hypothetical protein